MRGKIRVRGMGYSPRRAYIARNKGSVCAKCGAELTDKELTAIWRLNMVESICFECPGWPQFITTRKTDDDHEEELY